MKCSNIAFNGKFLDSKALYQLGLSPAERKTCSRIIGKAARRFPEGIDIVLLNQNTLLPVKKIMGGGLFVPDDEVVTVAAGMVGPRLDFKEPISKIIEGINEFLRRNKI